MTVTIAPTMLATTATAFTRLLIVMMVMPVRTISALRELAIIFCQIVMMEMHVPMIAAILHQDAFILPSTAMTGTRARMTRVTTGSA